MSFQKIRAPSVKEVFVQEIKEKILSGELEIGQRLPPQRELCRTMGVSLTIVNAGITELAGKGLLEVIPRRGVYVADYRIHGTPETFFDMLQFNGRLLSGREIRSFTESRLALDPFVMKLVIEHASDEDLEQASEKLDAMKKCPTDPEFCISVTDFFHTLYLLSGNSFFPMLYHSTARLQSGMYELFVERNGREPVLRNAGEILDALKRRDVKDAQEAAWNGPMEALEGPCAIVDGKERNEEQ